MNLFKKKDEKYNITLEEWEFLYKYFSNDQENFERSWKRIFLYLAKHKNKISEYFKKIWIDIEKEDFKYIYISDDITANQKIFSIEANELLELPINSETLTVFSSMIFRGMEIKDTEQKYKGILKSGIIFTFVYWLVWNWIANQLSWIFWPESSIWKAGTFDLDWTIAYMIFNNSLLITWLFLSIIFFWVFYRIYFNQFLKQWIEIFKKKNEITLLQHIVLNFNKKYKNEQWFEEIWSLDNKKILNSYIKTHWKFFLEENLFKIMDFFSHWGNIKTENIDFNIRIESIFHKLNKLRVKGWNEKVKTYYTYQKELNLLFDSYKREKDDFLLKFKGKIDMITLYQFIFTMFYTIAQVWPIVQTI